MTTPTVSRVEQLRPWADAPCPEIAQDPLNHEAFGGGCPSCGGSGYDPRCDALRGEHELTLGKYRHGRLPFCAHCGEKIPRNGPISFVAPSGYEYVEAEFGTPYCLHTDLSALARVAAACGLAVAYMGPVVGGYDGHQVVLQNWHGYFKPTDDKHLGQGDTDEDAFATALVAALPERAS